MSRFKIVLFLTSVALAAACVAGAWWAYTHVLGKDAVVTKQIKQMQDNKKDLPDPGLHRFDNAVNTLKSGDIAAGRDELYELLRNFPGSICATEAKRIIGEMNLDAMFSQNLNTAKKDYIVRPGDSLGLIARKNETTVECIMRANAMMSSGLQPGDHLFIFPLDFDIIISVSAKTLTLLRNGRFFKEYQALDVKLPPGMKVAASIATVTSTESTQSAPPAAVPVAKTTGKKKTASHAAPAPPGELTVHDKAAWVEGKRVLSTDSHFNSADKWLMSSRVGFNIRALPQATALSGQSTIIQPKSLSSTSNKTTPKPPAKNSKPASLPVSNVQEDESTAAPESGVFLAREDTEELFTIIRTGTKIRVIK